MTEKSIDALTERVQRALSAPGCERFAEWAAIGPVQRAAVEQFAQSLVQPALDVDALSEAIMNLPPTPPGFSTGWDVYDGYKIGHRDARHAAAELVNAMKETK